MEQSSLQVWAGFTRRAPSAACDREHSQSHSQWDQSHGYSAVRAVTGRHTCSSHDHEWGRRHPASGATNGRLAGVVAVELAVSVVAGLQRVLMWIWIVLVIVWILATLLTVGLCRAAGQGDGRR